MRRASDRAQAALAIEWRQNALSLKPAHLPSAKQPVMAAAVIRLRVVCKPRKLIACWIVVAFTCRP
jgi:hypothetical protein